MLPPSLPRPLADTKEIQRRIELLHEPHINALTNFVIQIRETEGNNSIPWFDPLGGGINAKALLLLQDPSNIAKKTGFISPDNPDVTANNTTWFRNQANLHTHELVHWNVIPWKMQNGFATEIHHAEPYLKQLFEILNQLKVVVCVGSKARDGWNIAFPDKPCKPGWIRLDELVIGGEELIVLSCPHPSRQGIGGKNGYVIIDELNPSERILHTLQNARFYLDNIHQ